MRKVPTVRHAVQAQSSYFTFTMTRKKYTLHGSKIGKPTSRVCHPRLRLGWQFTRDMDCPSFFLLRCLIYYLIPQRYKAISSKNSRIKAISLFNSLPNNLKNICNLDYFCGITMYTVITFSYWFNK